MTTITIKNGDLKKTSFNDLEELFTFLIDKQEYGKLYPLTNSDITQEQEIRFKTALATDKSEMNNI